MLIRIEGDSTIGNIGHLKNPLEHWKRYLLHGLLLDNPHEHWQPLRRNKGASAEASFMHVLKNWHEPC